MTTLRDRMVEIERWKEPLPPVRAFEPPEVAWIS